MSRRIVIGLLPLLLACTLRAAEPVTVTFRILIDNGSPVADGTILELNGADQRSERIPIRGGSATVVLEPGAWNWRIEDGSIASSPYPEIITPSTSRIDLHAKRLAPVALRIADIDHEELLVSLGVSGVVIPCRGTGRERTCMIPAGEHAVELRVQGWKAVPLGTHEIPLNGYDLGELHLPSRGSLEGAIESSEEVTVRLQRDRDVRNASSRSIETQVVDDRGRFIFEELPPGKYWVAARTSSGSSDRWGPFEVGDEAVEITEPFALAVAGAIEMQIVPPLDPFGESWRVSLVPVDEDPRARHEEIELDRPDDIGRVSSGPISPGEYIIRIVFNDSGATFARRVVDVAPEATVIEQLMIEPVRLLATVTIDEEPVAGGMVEILPLEAEINIGPDGRFETFLPEEGAYTFDLATSGRNVIRALNVERDGSGDARLEIDATTVELGGQVIDAGGEPVDATVTARWNGFEKVVAAKEGLFLFDVPRHTRDVVLRATSSGETTMIGDLASARLSLDVDDEPLTEETLMMIPARELELDLSAAPEAGTIFYGGDDVWDLIYTRDPVVTVALPVDIRDVTLCVLPRESGLRCSSHRAAAQRMSATGDEPYGELVLEADGALVPSEVPLFHLYQDGVEIPAEVIDLWTESLDLDNPISGRVLIPRVAASEVRVCGVEVTEHGAVEETRCVDGVIHPMQRTVLEIPVE